MDILLAFLWVIFIVFMSIRSEKKKQAKRKRRPVAFAPEPVEEEADWEPAEPSVQVPEPFEVAKGEDAEGCVGGSMAHTQHEGETRREHRRHMAAAARRELEDRAREATQTGSDEKLKRLRQAVVMAEILDKPVALRRR